MAGTKTHSGSSRSRKQLKISYVDSVEDSSRNEERRSPVRSSRRTRVHPEGRRAPKAMDEGDKDRSKRITVQTVCKDERQLSSGIRGSKDWRSPGVKMTPTANTAARYPSDGQVVPDFITQTDANGNATTPRSAAAINGARKSHPTGRRPNLHVDNRGELSEDDSDDNSEKGEICSTDDPCEMLLESLRMMCCCFMDDVKPGRSLTGQVTQESDDRPRLLGDLHPDDHGKKCLVLDLDETLVHSSFRAVPNADFVIPVQIEDVVHFVYVAKRPGVDEFLVEMAKHYEIVIYTASLNKYADPLLDLLDPKKVIRTRLFRESCVYYEGNYVKDLSLLDRDLRDTIIIDNSPSSYMFHPENAIDCSSFIDDPRDRELDQIGAFLTGIKDIKDVRGICPQWRNWPAIDLNGQTPGKGQ